MPRMPDQPFFYSLKKVRLLISVFELAAILEGTVRRKGTYDILPGLLICIRCCHCWRRLFRGVVAIVSLGKALWID